jgi:hypothetical protein
LVGVVLWVLAAACVVAVLLSLWREVRPASQVHTAFEIGLGVCGGVVVSFVSPTSNVDLRLVVIAFTIAAFIVTLGHPFDLAPESIEIRRERPQNANTEGPSRQPDDRPCSGAVSVRCLVAEDLTSHPTPPSAPDVP